MAGWGLPTERLDRWIREEAPPQPELVVVEKREGRFVHYRLIR